jgi:uncharacterized YceG family protein
MAERRQHGLRRGATPRRTIMVRRFGALGALVLALVVVGAIVLSHRSGGTAAPTTTVAAPPPKPFRIIFPEGFTRADMAHRVAVVAKIAEQKSKKRVRLTPGGYLHWSQPRAVAGFGRGRKSLEGFLFPATYDFLKATTSRQLVEDQLSAFGENWRKLNLRYARTKHLTNYDILIIASMVERETLAPSERPLVAAVIYNRLKAGMPLGIDATIRYGLHVPGTEPLHESQLQSDNPYNTRKFAGLPPTPIGNPGLASLQAAAHPANVDYLYFVRKPDKVHHYFTSSFQDFQNHEVQYGYTR